MLWGDKGKPISWKWDSRSEVGTKHDLVLSVDFRDNNLVIGNLIACGTVVRMMTPTNVPDSTAVISVMGATLIDKMFMPTFQAGDPSMTLQHPRWNRSDAKNVVEFCSGMGVGTHGLRAAGFSVVCAVDSNPLFSQAFEDLHPGTPTVVGSVGLSATVARVHSIHPRPTTIAAGFSCQPFSMGGAMQGALDSRSQCLPEVLNAAFLLQCTALVLECVPNAGTNRMVQDVIQTFCKECKYVYSEVNLKLDDVWVSRRDRWWAVLTPLALGKCPLKAFVDMSYPSVVRHVLPEPLFFPRQDLLQLSLSIEEQKVFARHCPNAHSMMLSLGTTAPTALHSWGSQASACHCLRRSQGFSTATLQDKGLYGILLPLDLHELGVQLPCADFAAVRHPHPTEVALLNGLVPPDAWPSDLRLVLAGLGQMAAPLHMLWVGSQLQAFFDRFHRGTTQVCPNSLLDDYRAKVLQAAKSMPKITAIPQDSEVCQCPVLPVDSPSASPLVTPWYGLSHQGAASACSVWFCVGSVLEIPLSSLALTVGDLLQAHNALCPGLVLECFDCSDGERAPPDAVLNGRCFALVPRVVDVTGGPPLDLPAVPVSPTLPWSVDVTPVYEPLAHDPDVPLVPPAVVATCEVPVEPEAKRIRVDEACADRCLHQEVDPLVLLNATELLGIECPEIFDVNGFLSLRANKIRGRDRLALLDRQQQVWADDELTWHMHQLITDKPQGQWVVLDPLIATTAALSGKVGILNNWYQDLGFQPKHIISAVHLGGHWTPFVWMPHAHNLLVQSWDVPGPSDRRLSKLHQILANVTGSRNFTWKNVTQRFNSNELCGACALAFLRNVVNEDSLPKTRDEALALHDAARNEFSSFVHFCFQVPRPWMWGSGLDSKADERLRNLLQDHGVPSEAIDSRIHLILQAFDRQKLQSALTNAQPWRNLKAHANQLQPVFQLVLPQELDEVVRRKATKGVGKGRKKKTQISESAIPKAAPPPELDPSKLMLEDGSFINANGGALRQVPLAKVGPFCEGVVMTTIPEAQAYLKAGHVVSSGALGFVLLNAEHTLLDTKLAWSSIRIVARCQANGGPMLLPALLVQLGKIAVGQKQSQSPCVIPSVDAACIKVSVYRDMVPIPWPEFVASPVRFVLQQLAPLSKCTCDCTETCDSAFWHATEADVVQDPVLDIWRKQWVTSTFKPALPHAADIYLLNIRYLGSLEEKILPYSGVGGVFVEPRSLCAKHPVLDFQVLWLGKSDISELQRLQSCHSSIQRTCEDGVTTGSESCNRRCSRCSQGPETRFHFSSLRHQSHI